MLLVVLDHAGIALLPGGFVGVDVFFVLSGFLITGLLLAEARANGSVSLIDFYLRRARRILPAAALTLLVTDVAAVFLLNFVRARDAVGDSLYAAGFAANVRFAARGVDYFARTDAPSPLLHCWSLSVEEQFYFVWPALLSAVLFGIALTRRRRTRGGSPDRRLLVVAVLLTVVSFGWSVHLTAAQPQTAYFSPFTRAWELGLGAVLAIGVPTLMRVPPRCRLAIGWAGLLAITVAAVTYSDRTPFPGSAALLPTAGAALAIAAGIGDRQPRLAAGRVLAARPLCFVGDRSYAYYLWHWPVLILAAQYAGHELSLPVNLGLLAGAFLLSCASYALVENPIRHGMRSRGQAGIVFGVAMGSVLAAAVLSLAAIDRQSRQFTEAASAAVARPVAAEPKIGANGVLPEVVAAVRSARRGDGLPSRLTPPIIGLLNVPAPYALPKGCISQESSSESTSKICRVGRANSRKLIVLFGDSHAMMWLPAVTKMALRDGWAVVPLLRTGCMPNLWITDDASPPCRQWYRWAIGQVRLLHPRVTLVGGSVGERPTPGPLAAADGIVAAASALRRFGKVVVIGDPEGLSDDPVDCLLSRRASMARCTTTWPPASLSLYDSVASRARHMGVGFIGTRGFVCFERRCPAVIGHTIAYWDNSHLTAAYVIQVAAPFRTAFVRATPERPR